MKKKESETERVAKGLLLILCSVALIIAFIWWTQGNGEYGGRRHPIALVFLVFPALAMGSE
jgi:uncharacterized membrane protein